MLYRCRWCERAFCEDCLDWDSSALQGENLREYELLGFPEVAQAYYVKCHACINYHKENEEVRVFCEGKDREINKKYERYLDDQADAECLQNDEVASQRSFDSFESMTEGPTLENSALNTPAPIEVSGGKKRKRDLDETFEGSASKKQLTKSLQMVMP